MDLNVSLINNFCSSLDTKYLDLIDYDTKQFFIKVAQYVLTNKVGNQEIAKIVVDTLQHEKEEKNYLVSQLLGDYLKETETRDYKKLVALGTPREEAMQYIKHLKSKGGGCLNSTINTVEFLKQLLSKNPNLETIDLTGCIITDEVVDFLKQTSINTVYFDYSYGNLYAYWSNIFSPLNNNGIPPFPSEMIEKLGKEFPNKFIYSHDGIKYINNPWDPWFSIMKHSLNTEMSTIDPVLVSNDANELKVSGYNDWVYETNDPSGNPWVGEDIDFYKKALEKGLDPQLGLNALFNTFIDGSRCGSDYAERDDDYGIKFKDFFLPFIKAGAIPDLSILFRNYIKFPEDQFIIYLEIITNNSNIEGMILQSLYNIDPTLIVGKIDKYLPSNWNSIVPQYWEDNIGADSGYIIPEKDVIWGNFKNYGFLETYVKK